MKQHRNLAAALGGWSARHRKTAVLGWLLLVALATVIGGSGGQVGLTRAEQGAGESARAERILADAGITRATTEMVLIRGSGRPVAATTVREVRDKVLATGAVGELRPTVTSADGHDVLIRFSMTGDPDTAADRVQPLLDAVASVQRAHPEVTVSEVGDASGQKWFQHMLGTDFARAEWTAVPLALGILLVAFGALLAAVLPVALALTAFLAALGLLSAISRLLPMDESANSVMLLMGLAVGVDYCLFYIRREREERAAGRTREEALRVAAATSGRSVLISGVTVIVAMAGMFLTGLKIFDGFAAATILVVFISMTGSVTVLPALLSLLGDRVEFGRMPWRRGPRRRREGGFWDAVLRPVLARPGVFAALAAALLLGLAAPALGMHTEKLSIDRQLPAANPLVQTYAAISRAFPGGPAPATVVLKAPDLRAPAVQRAISALAQAVPGARVTQHRAANVAEIEVPLADTSALTELRNRTIPRTVGGAAEVAVAGDLAFSVDYNARLRAGIVPVFAFVMGVTFLLMLVSFRSIVIAVTAIILNLLSVAASYGVMVAVFQHGWGARLIGTHAPGALESWIPLFVFVVLFGLSMDYHVFVVSRIQEARSAGLPTTAAVAHGIRSTAGVVTSAAVIMIAVFSIFATLSMQDFKQLGVGLAVAILIDATVVRAVLLPSVMTLLGERNWYLPRRPGRLPRRSPAGPVRTAAEPPGSALVTGSRSTEDLPAA
ncbi:MMPL family transporter [Actinomadura scrupuli]|uniref:MMPL family transporter n=1 Tax=Actinomadura scrupuli TaxID=559629 RepID=UPI003D969CF3